MAKIVGVRFRNAGKVYSFDPKDYELKNGDHVVVETSRGIEYGTVIGGVREISDESRPEGMKDVLRKSTPEDDEMILRYREKEREAMAICREKIHKHELDMKLVAVEYAFDGTKILFYFTADGRIDFRELVKDLASVFRTRIELRQIGVRDETKMLGGIGICGRELCCASYLSDFVPVSIKMAKEQNLSLNPTKISGVCGRLMCCLKNEEETYEYLNGNLPTLGQEVTLPDGRTGEVATVNVLRQKVRVLIQNGDSVDAEDYPVAELEFERHKHKAGSGNGTPKRKKKGGDAAANGGNQNAAPKAAEPKSQKEHTEYKEAVITETEIAVSEIESDQTAAVGIEVVSEEISVETAGKAGEERANRSDRPRRDRNARRERGERQERGEKNDRGEKTERGDRQDRGERPERGERKKRSDKPARSDRNGADRPERGDKNEQRERPDRGDRNRRNGNDRKPGAPAEARKDNRRNEMNEEGAERRKRPRRRHRGQGGTGENGEGQSGNAPQRQAPPTGSLAAFDERS